MDFYNVKAHNYDIIQDHGNGYQSSCMKLRGLSTIDGKLQTSELVNIANETEDGIRIIRKNSSKKE